MCDYSLYAIPNRLAVEDEELVAYRFQTGSIGLASPADLNRACEASRRKERGYWAWLKQLFAPAAAPPAPAVCIPPGAQLIISDIPQRLQAELGVGPEEEVVFVQTTAAAHTYRDAVLFHNGRVAGLQELKEGQRVRVISLAAAESRVDPPEFEWLEELDRSAAQARM